MPSGPASTNPPSPVGAAAASGSVTGAAAGSPASHRHRNRPGTRHRPPSGDRSPRLPASRVLPTSDAGRRYAHGRVRVCPCTRLRGFVIRGSVDRWIVCVEPSETTSQRIGHSRDRPGPAGDHGAASATVRLATVRSATVRFATAGPRQARNGLDLDPGRAVGYIGSYIRVIRQKLGSRLLLITGAQVMLVNEQGSVSSSGGGISVSGSFRPAPVRREAASPARRSRNSERNRTLRTAGGSDPLRLALRPGGPRREIPQRRPSEPPGSRTPGRRRICSRTSYTSVQSFQCSALFRDPCSIGMSRPMAGTRPRGTELRAEVVFGNPMEGVSRTTHGLDLSVRTADTSTARESKMRKIIHLVHQSVDGYIEGPNGDSTGRG